jgi:hypothetical protein
MEISVIPVELLKEILSYISCGHDYKTCRLVCSLWMRLTTDKKKILQYCDQLWTLVRLCPDKPWDWQGFGWNEFVSKGMFNEFMDKKDIWNNVGRRPWVDMGFLRQWVDQVGWIAASKGVKVTMDELKQNLDLPWKWTCLSNNPNITMDMIENNPELPWVCPTISDNPNITMEFIKSRGDIQWNWYAISASKYIDLPTLRAHVHQIQWLDASSNYAISVETIMSNLDLPWCFGTISFRRDLKFETVLARLDLKWDWRGISQCPGVTFDMIMENLDLPWDPDAVSHNPNVTMEIIRDNPTYPWNYKWIGFNPNITIEFIRQNKDRVDWRGVSQNSCITILDIMENLDLPWDWQYLSYCFGKKKQSKLLP